MAILIRMPEALDLRVRHKAESLGVSINALVCVALSEYVSRATEAPQRSQNAPVALPPVPVHTHTRKQRRALDRKNRKNSGAVTS
jgi:hypothetical protein